MQNDKYSLDGPATPPASSATPACDVKTSIAPKQSQPQNPAIIASIDKEDSTKTASSSDAEPQAPLTQPVTRTQGTSTGPDAEARKPQLLESAVQETSKASSSHVAQASAPLELPSTSLGYNFNHQATATKIYKPIQPWQIRVICLRPATFSEPLVCSLETANMIIYEGLSLQDTSVGILYEALSYTWQGESSTQPITVNAELYGVTPNLSSALRHLRNETSGRYIFVDALSINQYDVAERSIQVERMLSVYQKAWRVVAWLGTNGDTSNLATSRFDSFQTCDVNGVDKKIYWHSWLQRTWVRQEVFAARNLYVQYGHKEIPWPDYIQVFHAARGTASDPTVIGNMSKTGGEDGIEQDVRQFNSGQPGDRYTPHTSSITPPPLHHVLCTGYSFQEADPRDKLFAILEIAKIDPKRRQSALIKPDYSKSVGHVFADVTRFLMKDFGLDVILQPKSAVYVDPLPGLPNWALDWRYRHKFNFDWDLPLWVPVNRNRNQAECLSKSTDQLTTSNNYMELNLTGWSFGKIRIVGSVYDNLEKTRRPITWTRLRKWCAEPFQLAIADEIPDYGYFTVSGQIQTGQQLVALKSPIDDIKLVLVDEITDGLYRLLGPAFGLGDGYFSNDVPTLDGGSRILRYFLA